MEHWSRVLIATGLDARQRFREREHGNVIVAGLSPRGDHILKRRTNIGAHHKPNRIAVFQLWSDAKDQEGVRICRAQGCGECRRFGLKRSARGCGIAVVLATDH